VSNDFYGVGAEAMIDAGADAIAIAEDLGFKTGTFASPEVYRRHLFPYLRELIDRARRRDVPVFLHSDGDINQVLDDLVGFGISAIHPVERKSNMDIAELRSRYGTGVCLVGNISASDTLPYGPLQRIEEEVKETIRKAGGQGAYVLASDSDYHDGIPPENFIAMVRAGKKYGRYPIV
jgi:uroporphyrinogen decarboxylase